jgi:fumarate reductase flavoprotein subunit
MWDDVGVLRQQASMQRGLATIQQHRQDLMQMGVADGDRRYNVTWHDWLNLQSLVDISQVITLSALARENSRGAHYREDFPEPGDFESSCFTRVHGDVQSLNLEMVPVSFDIVRPGESLLDESANPKVAQPA